MTPDDFRRLALSLPEAEESSHMDHPDFRIRGKIFATLAPGGEWGMVKLTPEQQREWVRALPEMFQPVKGGWGKKGCTNIILATADAETIRKALAEAWRNTAPKKLAEQFDHD